MLAMKQKCILDQSFESLTERDKRWFVGVFFFKFSRSAQKMSGTFLFGKSIDCSIISRIEVRVKSAIILSAQMILDNITGAVAVDMIEGQLLIGKCPEPIRLSVDFPACLIGVDISSIGQEAFKAIIKR